MIVRNHIFASSIIAGIWYYIFKSIPEAVVCLLGGFLIDVDHFIDYYVNHPFTLDFWKIYKACLNMDLKKVFVVLHSFELAAFIWAMALLMPDNRLWLALAVGVTQHIIFDQFRNYVHPLAYFMTYRISKGFQSKYYLRDEKERYRKFNRCVPE